MSCTDRPELLNLLTMMAALYSHMWTYRPENSLKFEGTAAMTHIRLILHWTLYYINHCIIKHCCFNINETKPVLISSLFALCLVSTSSEISFSTKTMSSKTIKQMHMWKINECYENIIKVPIAVSTIFYLTICEPAVISSHNNNNLI